MRFLILASLLILVFSCKISRNNKKDPPLASKSPECHEVISFLKKSWRKNKDGYFFLKQKATDYNKAYNSIFLTNCLKGEHKKEIKKIFGEPSAQYGFAYYYYMCAECAEGNPPYAFSNKCFLTTISFDKNDRVVGFLGWTRFAPPVH